MRTFKHSKTLVAAGLLAASAVFAAPTAFADNHGRGHDRGQVSHPRPPSHDDRRHDNRGHGRPQSWHDNRDHGRVVYTREVVRTRQPVFYRGRAIPVGYRHAIQPLPAAYRYRVPVAPRGYSVGYYQGYSVVYDPATFLIISVIDLLANG
jgi:Ni/Co efflux regulator RcnB